METLENIVEKIEGENYKIKKETNILKEEIKKLHMQSNELKRESQLLKEDNDSLREQNQKLMEFKRKYESCMSTPFKGESEMQISYVIDEIIIGKGDKIIEYEYEKNKKKTIIKNSLIENNENNK